MPDRKHKFYRLIFSTLLLVYIGTVLYLCFASFDPEFIQKESELFNLTDKEVHFLMFIPFVPLCFLSIGNYRWNFGRVVIFAIGLCIAAGVSAYAIELIQGTTEHRGKDVWDALAGLGGAVTGALLLVMGRGAHFLLERSDRAAMLVLFILGFGSIDGHAQRSVFCKSETDSLTLSIERRTGVRSRLELKKALKRGGKMDFYFSRELGDYPWHKDDMDWLKAEIRKTYSGRLGKLSVGEIFASGKPVRNFTVPELGNDGHPQKSPNRIAEPEVRANVVRSLDQPAAPLGLSGRNIALWPSHGCYYEPSLDRWEWRRACLFRTVEDIFTQSFSTQFLAPMLENAGAYVMMPRERDLGSDEYIIDNDSSQTSRTSGKFSYSGKWTVVREGFADSVETICDTLNPFLAGTSLKSGKNGKSRAEWSTTIVQEGDYAVYVAYRSYPESSENAHYCVEHSGGCSEFLVNQRIGGGTWIYLGDFHFTAGAAACVRLDAGEGSGILSADAVRIGGGRGNIARGPAEEVSGLPRGLEGARYSLQWYGAPQKVWHHWDEEENDYRDDYTSRGLWTGWVSGGSAMNRKEKGLGIPLDLALAFHTDAGTALRDSTIGTLVLYSSSNEGKKSLPSGEKMSTSREYAALVQSQVVADIRASFCPDFRRREIRDRAYMETRSPACPSMILELLSHQNFNDMKLGLDPGFRFVASRAVYKGILKYLANRYGVDYAVQPLPVKEFSAVIRGDKVVLSWTPREDPLEPTAVAEAYLLETRKDGTAFSNAQFVETETVDGRVSCSVPFERGRLWSFRVSAWNKGGKSFPSEILTVGMPLEAKGKVLIVNNFDRVSAPVHFEGETVASFNSGLDSGVDYLRSINYVGEMYEFRKGLDWADDDCPGFGASYTDCAELCPAGNSFDYPYVHALALMALGYGFDSMSAAAFAEVAATDADLGPDEYAALDLICGKQATTPYPNGFRYSIFPEKLRMALNCCNIPLIVSGSYIGSDPEGGIYEECEADKQARAFTSGSLGFKLMNGRASRKGTYRWTGRERRGRGSFNTDYSEDIYRVDAPDGIVPVSSRARTIMRYTDSGISAAVAYKGENGCAVSFGFPIETVKDAKDIEEIFSFCLDFFNQAEGL